MKELSTHFILRHLTLQSTVVESRDLFRKDGLTSEAQTPGGPQPLKRKQCRKNEITRLTKYLGMKADVSSAT